MKTRVMKGHRYVSQIREDLTFTVYNMFPDYVFPGKICAVRIAVDGGPEEDKVAHVEIDLDTGTRC